MPGSTCKVLRAKSRPNFCFFPAFFLDNSKKLGFTGRVLVPGVSESPNFEHSTGKLPHLNTARDPSSPSKATPAEVLYFFL